MASVTQELDDYIENKLSQGILNDEFVNMRGLQTEEDPSFVERTIETFIEASDSIMTELSGELFLDTEYVDAREVYAGVHRCANTLKGSSSSIGGAKVARASKKLMKEASKQAPEKQKCFEYFEELEHEYNILRDCLNKIAEMEEIIRTTT